STRIQISDTLIRTHSKNVSVSPNPVYFGEGLPEDGQVLEIEESLHHLEDHQLTSVEPTEEINIQMAEEDKIKTTFTTMWGTFCYHIMPFGLKNAEATYQRAMVTLFHDMMHKKVEFYVDDMIAKSKEGEDHLVNLKRLFDRLKEYKLRLNSAKCTFGARSGKLLGFVVSERGIEVDPDIVKAIKELPPPSTVREYPVAAKLDFSCTNNVAEYEACILGSQAVIDFKVKELEVFGDSMLTIFQTLGQWKTKDAKLIPYHEYLEELAKSFEKISFTYTPRTKNQFADGLATLASMASITKGNIIEPLEIAVAKGPAYCDAIKEVHGGSCGPHMNGLMLAKKLMRLGYYWSTMETDRVKHVRHCHRCQVYADQIKAPPNELRPMTAPWPFSMWGMDMIGPSHPKASNGHLFILVAIDYFTKWIEAITLTSITAKAVARYG
ncbi:hypothetical protein CRG98_008708, partial [Punica granatum]